MWYCNFGVCAYTYVTKSVELNVCVLLELYSATCTSYWTFGAQRTNQCYWTFWSPFLCYWTLGVTRACYWTFWVPCVCITGYLERLVYSLIDHWSAKCESMNIWSATCVYYWVFKAPRVCVTMVTGPFETTIWQSWRLAVANGGNTFVLSIPPSWIVAVQMYRYSFLWTFSEEPNFYTRLLIICSCPKNKKNCLLSDIGK